MSLVRASSAALVLLASLGAAGCLASGSDAGDGGAPGSGSDAGSAVAPGTTADGSVAQSSVDSGGGINLGGDAGATVSADGGTTATPAADASATTGGGAYKIDLDSTSVSGFSSGAFFAVQFHIAFSSILKGAAIFAGGPYDCAGGNATTAETTCLTGSPNAASLVTVTKSNYSSGAIDNPANLANQRVFLFGGADDSVVHPTVVDSLQTYYSSFMSASSIQYESRHAGTSHTMPTLSYGGDCDSVVSPYVGKCNYDGAGNALQQIYGTMNPAAATQTGTMLSFAQTKFVANATVEGLADTGYYYVPTSCANGATCKIHVSFHGCEQNAALVKDAYYGHAGYNEWADTNDIIVLYPQATSSSGNDYECWDFWGYDGSNYDEKSGTQLAAVRAMVDWIAGGAAGGSDAGTVTTTSGKDSGVTTTLPSFDASTASCTKASNTAQVSAGRATAVGGYAYAKGSNEFLGADTAATSSSLEELTSGYYIVCL